MFRNLLIANSGKGHVEEMVRTLRAIPPCRQARINLLHVVSEQAGDGFRSHRDRADALVAESVARMGLQPAEVNSIVRQGDTKQTVLKVADEVNADLIVIATSVAVVLAFLAHAADDPPTTIVFGLTLLHICFSLAFLWLLRRMGLRMVK